MAISTLKASLHYLLASVVAVENFKAILIPILCICSNFSLRKHKITFPFPGFWKSIMMCFDGGLLSFNVAQTWCIFSIWQLKSLVMRIFWNYFFNSYPHHHFSIRSLRNSLHLKLALLKLVFWIFLFCSIFLPICNHGHCFVFPESMPSLYLPPF